ncbi:MAG: hypothetical protein PVSMB9_10040 [Candidatus Dormibacteria bacterium]
MLVAAGVGMATVVLPLNAAAQDRPMSWLARPQRPPLRFTTAVLSTRLASSRVVPSGSVGYDVSYPNCGSAYPVTSRPAPPLGPVASAPGRAATSPPPLIPQSALRTARPLAPAVWATSRTNFGIVGVDSGYPFISATHPGNPCLKDEYTHAPNGALYINTGYDPSYLDASHTTTDCASRSSAVAGSTAQQQAWAVGCSEAQKDYAYAGSLGIKNPVPWWLDVELGNSWCGQPGTACTDLTLNRYSLQGVIDELQLVGSQPIGIYSNRTQWTAIVGSGTVTGAVYDWVASGTSTAQAAAAYCSSANSFSGAPVSIVQFMSNSTDFGYAC